MVHTISTGIAVTFAVPLLAVGAREAAGAVAGVAARDLLLAGASVEARIVRTSHRAGFAVLPVEALRAGAGVSVHQVLERRHRATQGQDRSVLPIRREHRERRRRGRGDRPGHSLCSCRHSCRGCCRTRWSRSHR